MRSVSKGCVPLVLSAVFTSPTALGQELTLPTATKMRATLTFDQLRQGIQTHRSELWALEVEYDVRTKGQGLPWVGYHFAMKGEKRLCFQTEKEPKGPQYGNAYNDEDVQIYNRDTKLAQVEKTKPAWLDLDFYAQAMRLAVSDEDRARANSLTSQLDAPALQWTVQPSLEIVDGSECHVLVSNSSRTRVWVDPHIGFAIRFQEMYQQVKDSPQAEWPLLSRHSYGNFKETAPGVYLPTKIVIVQYTSVRSPRHLWNRQAFSQVMDVTKLAVGDQVEDSVFRFQFPPGTTVDDHVRGRFYRIGNAGEELDMLVGRGLEELEKSRSMTSRAMVVINLAALLVFVALLIYRLLGRKRSCIDEM